MTPDQAAAAFERSAVALPAALAEAETQAIHAALAAARKLSEGALTPSEMDALGHPYAARLGGAAVPGDPAVVNRGQGDFLEHWSIESQGSEEDGVANRLYNDSQVAEWLDGGTRKTIPRPFLARIEERAEGEREKLVEKALDKNLP